MSYTSIQIEGGLLSPDFLDRIHDMPGQKPADFGLERNRSLVDEASTVWSDLRAYWTAFQRRMTRAQDDEGASLTTITREQWMIPLLETLNYHLQYQRSGAVVNGQIYAISHRDLSDPGAQEEAELGLPVHIVGFDQPLGSRPTAGRGRMSPHALLQDYLNRTEHLWGIVTNGAVLRLLRDSTYFSRPSYIEFDLVQMLTDERFDEFIVLYRLVHRSRLPAAMTEVDGALLEQYYQDALDQGGRIRDGLRAAVEEAIRLLGNGFLHHPKNEALRARLDAGEVTPYQLYQQLLYLIYRLLFLMVAEGRNLLGDGNGGAPELYDHFSISRLRKLAETPLSGPERFDDLYLGLRTLFDLLREDEMAARVRLTALNGELFQKTPDLDRAHLTNRDLLQAVYHLSFFTPAEDKIQRRVNYAALDVEELGSVYESLLEEHPVIAEFNGRQEFGFVQGTERKTTGSHYTPRELVQELIESALQPVIADQLEQAGSDPAAREDALLALNVCDPACGSGHFLLAAARRIGRTLAQVRTGEEEPAPEAVRDAIRDAITHCIYGVDKNPMAVDLCKVALWIEGHSVGRPLAFLDFHIRCGDSLLGVHELGVLDEGIPDDAFHHATGDDRSTATNFRSRNKREREGQLGLDEEIELDRLDVSAEWDALVDMPEETPEEVRAKQSAFYELTNAEAWQRETMACNLWTAAFFAEFTGDAQKDARIPTTLDLRSWRHGRDIDGRISGYAAALAHRNRFFHWPLQFPQVFAQGGFDIILGNPPWERIKIQEKEWFANRAPYIAGAPNAAARRRLIAELEESDPGLFVEFQRAKHAAENASNLLRQSGQYPLCGRGDINTYSVFAELSRTIVSPNGRIGIIVPTGIATDDTTKYYFQAITDGRSLVSLHSFENEARIFPNVHNQMKFCLLTIAGPAVNITKADFVFFARVASDLRDEWRHFGLTAEDIRLINPNSGTCATFRSKRDAEITKAVYRRIPVLSRDDSDNGNPWQLQFGTQFHMANDAQYFLTRAELEDQGFSLDGNYFVGSGKRFLPLYEAKMFYHFDHRYSTYEDATQAELNAGRLPKTNEVQKANMNFVVMPRYWVDESEVVRRAGTDADWYMAFRDVTNSVSERTSIVSLLPWSAVGHKAPLICLDDHRDWLSTSVLISNMNSFAFDYIARQKIGGTSMSYFILKQLPFPSLEQSIQDCPYSDQIEYAVLELCNTSIDIAESLRWHSGLTMPSSLSLAPSVYDEERRFLLRCELDASYFHLYGIAREDVDYIMETFPLVKRKEEAAHREYRTKRVILEIYDEMAAAMAGGPPYRTRLDPPPADVRVTHPPRGTVKAASDLWHIQDLIRYLPPTGPFVVVLSEDEAPAGSAGRYRCTPVDPSAPPPAPDTLVIVRHPNLHRGGQPVSAAAGRWAVQHLTDATTGQPVYHVLLRGLTPPVELRLTAEEWAKFRPVGILTHLTES